LAGAPGGRGCGHIHKGTKAMAGWLAIKHSLLAQLCKHTPIPRHQHRLVHAVAGSANCPWNKQPCNVQPPGAKPNTLRQLISLQHSLHQTPAPVTEQQPGHPTRLPPICVPVAGHSKSPVQVQLAAAPVTARASPCRMCNLIALFVVLGCALQEAACARCNSPSDTGMPAADGCPASKFCKQRHVQQGPGKRTACKGGAQH
jgi:hypothetical protein